MEDKFLKIPNNPERSDKEIEGHPPIQFIEGKYICLERGLVSPEFDIGPEEYHRKLFIEYERTFGRGEAKHLTHGGANYLPGTDSEERFNKKYGPNLVEEYQKFASQIRGLLFNGEKEKCDNMMKELGEFRRKHPNLYSDVVDPNRPKKKFEIINRQDTEF